METGSRKAAFINHDAGTGEVNLLQVAGYVRAENARRHATASMKALGIAPRADKKIRGIGKNVLVGTYAEALKIAEHLGADNDKLNAIKESLKAVAPGDNASPIIATEPVVNEPTANEPAANEPASNEPTANGGDGSGLGESAESDATHDFVGNAGDKAKGHSSPEIFIESLAKDGDILDLSIAKDMILEVMRSENAFPIVFDETWSKFMGYKYHKDANDKINKLIDRNALRLDFHLRKEYYVNLNNGKNLQRFRFSKRGIKSFFMSVPTAEGERFREYYLDLEEEYSVVVPELLKAQKKIAAQEEEIKNLRREKEVAHTWGRTRDASYDVQKETMAELKSIVDRVGTATSAPLYAVVNDALNKSVLGFPGTTAAFKKSLGISDKDRLSIPDILSAEGLEERMRLSKHFFRFFRTNFGDLTSKSYEEIKSLVYHIATANGKINAFIGDLHKELLSVDEAKKRKRDHERSLKDERKAKGIKEGANASPAAPATVVNNITVNVNPEQIASKVVQQLTMDMFLKK